MGASLNDVPQAHMTLTHTQVHYGLTSGLKRVPIVINPLECFCGDTVNSRFQSATITYSNKTQEKLDGDVVETLLADKGIKF